MHLLELLLRIKSVKLRLMLMMEMKKIVRFIVIQMTMFFLTRIIVNLKL
nr:MAG TPA: hypothetical protein [Caudoviricetes sp.]